MRIEYEDDELCRLAAGEITYVKRWPPSVTQIFYRRIQLIEAAVDERGLRAMKALHFEKLQGKSWAGCWSIRFDKKYRLILRFTTDAAGRITVIVDGLDYH